MDNRRGISLIMLIVTIVLALILIMSTAAVVGNAINNSRITTFASDVLEVEDAVKSYYTQHDEMPILGEDKVYSQKEIGELVQKGKQLVLFEEELDLNGDFNVNGELGAFYIVDLGKIGIEQTSRGLKKDNSDVYAVSYPSFHVYYLKGLNTRKTSYFSMTSRLSSLIKTFNRKTTALSTQVTTQMVEGITVKKINKKWTNVLGVTVETYISDTSESLYLKVQNGAEVLIPTKTGQNVLRLDSLTKALAADGTNYTLNTDLSKYNAAQQKDKYMEIIKKKSGNIVGRVRTNLQEYETEIPTLKGEITLYPSEEYNLATFYIGDNISGTKEVRYEYLTKFNSQTYPEPYYAGITTYEPSYIKARGKKATVSEDGYVEIKIPKEIEGIEVRAFDNAGNVSNKITISNKRDIYIGINAKYLTKIKSVFDIVFNSNSKITSAKVSISNNASNFTDPIILTVPTPTSGIAKVEDIKFNSLINYTDTIYVKISAINANGTTETRIQKFTLNNVQTDLVTPGILVTKNTYYLMDGKLAMIPKGFAVSTKINEQSIDNGLVILDEIGNEFVWVPVDNIADFERVDWPVQLRTVAETPEDEATTEYMAMKESVSLYKGYYIARYEAGIPSTTSSTTINHNTKVDGSIKPVSKKGAGVWNFISWGTSANTVSPGNGAVTVARAMYPNDSRNQTGVISTLCYDVQWDMALRLIEKKDPIYPGDSTGKGNYTGKISTTGDKSEYQRNNIYDMAGNMFEYTMASYNSNTKVVRGGSYIWVDSKVPAGYRDGRSYADIYESLGFRVALYIKPDMSDAVNVDPIYKTSNAMDILCKLSTRNFYKYNDEEAYVAIVYFTSATSESDYMAPLLVGPTSSSVVYCTDHDMQPLSATGSFTYNGKTYYYSSTGQWMSTTVYTTNRVLLNTASTRYINSISGMEDAARDLLKKCLNY
ncbi:MAG: hypothetical protein PHP54_02820 [Clostridia bacterium]|nr:hypothetical protein [Clostridia bacterium]